ncbi:DNA-directed RNA polymerase III subunit RPC3-like protein [Dinothrombium tinctorium]|uniref:DNA-directed RNA polymerase III subunit RPC3 n=1 Tax=Dinothrombium tinctorium TaxID=1965070 RepID=A0A3S3PU10_9ACAR|nr:DNA-directed RNA polymerase III subunit RPC3-like protein [Dinothrombium tinctorium]RWS10594.1 DNA-directed RNA polymerase III subunit RPC3-like protein [Dinothrombium tinctorium]RWS16359.1 DNA-directed RNA polymerase III subunit RPC3-like protein [Dinothrombium tinctorium]
MSKNEIELCAKLLNEHFGAVVETVASHLMKEGSLPFKLILASVKQPILEVKKALKVLIYHQFVDVFVNSIGFFEYSVNIERILFIIRYPKYIYVAKLLYNDYGEHIIEELLKEGQLTMSSVIQRVVNRLKPALTEDEIRKVPKSIFDTFVKMAETRFIRRTADFSEKSVENQLKELDDEAETKQFEIPKVKLNLIEIEKDDSDTVSSKRIKLDTSQPDDGIYWAVNFARFHQYMRDLLVLDAIKTHYDDEKAVEIARIIFRLTETKMLPLAKVTPSVSKQDICNQALKESICSSSSEVDLYLRMFNDDVNYRFISKVEESAGGGMYAINIFKTIDKLLHFTITSIVESQFGSKTCRIFRLVLTKKYLQQKQIEDTAMIPSKDCKELLYLLFKEGFLKTMQFPKQPDYAPSRTCFVFTVDIPDLCRTLIQKCFCAVHNAIVRRTYETQQHKLLLERKVFIDAVIANLQQQNSGEDVQQQIEDLNQSFSTHDKELLGRIQKLTTKLELSECQVDETLFLMQTWVLMNFQ